MILLTAESIIWTETCNHVPDALRENHDS